LNGKSIKNKPKYITLNDWRVRNEVKVRNRFAELGEIDNEKPVEAIDGNLERKPKVSIPKYNKQVKSTTTVCTTCPCISTRPIASIPVRRKRRFKLIEAEKLLNEINHEEEISGAPAVAGSVEPWESTLTRRRPNPPEFLNVLNTIEPEGLNGVSQKQEEWIEVVFAVDSGATETVMREEMLEEIETVEGRAFKRGVKYEVANGVRIDNLGEKRFTGVTTEGSQRNMTAQICRVNKALLSVRKVVSAGNRVDFDECQLHRKQKTQGNVL